MARYIDAEKLIQRLEREVESCKDPNRGSVLGFKMAIFIVKTIRSDADVVPREEHEELIYKLECLLCCASGGKLSKHTYNLKTMETVVNDYINESYYDGAKDTAKEIFHEIFEIIKKYEFDALVAKENYGVFQVRNFGCDVMKLREKYGITDTAPKEKGGAK